MPWALGHIGFEMPPDFGLLLFLGGVAIACAWAWWRETRRRQAVQSELTSWTARLASLNLAFEQSAVSMMVTDLKGSIQFVNPAFEHITGYSLSEVVGKNPRLLKSGQHNSEFYKGMWGVLMRGKSWRGDICNRRKDGSLFWFRSVISPVREDGITVAYVAIQEEFSSQVAIEDERRELSQRLTKIASQLPGMIYQLRMDADNRLTFPFASEGVRTIFGISPQEIRRDAQPFLNKIEPEFLPLFLDSLHGSRDALSPWQTTFAVKDALSQPRWIETNAMPDQQEDGSVMWHGYATDITERRRIEEEYERLSLVAQKTSNGVFIVNNRGLIEWCNPAFEELTGYRQQELMGRSPIELLTGSESLEENLELLRECLHSGIGFSRDLVSYSKQGKPYWAHLDITPVRGGDSEIEQFIGIQTNITERKQAEEEMNLLADRLSIATDSSGIGVWDLDLASQHLVWDDRMYSLYGCEYAEFKGALSDWMERIHPSDLARTQALLREAIDNNRPFETDFRIRRADNGKDRHVKAFARLVGDGDGKRRRLIGTNWDITALKVAEAELRESEARFRTLYELSPIGIALITMEGRFVQANRTLETTLGYSSGELAGLTFWEISPPNSQREDVLQFDLLMREGRCGPYEKEFLHKDGRAVSVLVGGAVVHNQDGSRKIWVVIQDISLRKEMERGLVEARQSAEDATRAKSAFLATMSHEIRTPMNGVIGMTSLLLESPLNEEQREFVQTIRTSGDTLLALINDILDFSKIESGRLDLEQAPFEISGAIEDALDLLAHQAAQKHLELAYIVEDTVPHQIFGDVTRVRQILVNLVGNAVKFTAKGEVLVSVTAKPSEEGRCEIHVAVKDTGIGIPPDRLGRLFQPFSQVDSSTTRKFGGTGLGLAICRRLTQAMGGEMWVESVQGVGSTFNFTFVAGVHVRSLSEVASPSSSDLLVGKRVLIVDDNATCRRILERHADVWGLKTTLTDSGRRALALLKSGTRFDAIILDMHMPDMDGKDTADAINGLGLVPAIPVVLSATLGLLPKLKQANVAAVISKPIKPAALREALLRIVGKTSAEPPARSRIPPADTQKLREASVLRILLAEDNPINQRVAGLVLKRLGYSCDTANNGLEVLDAIKRVAYDVILMDCLMPELDGYDTARRIREQDIRRPDGAPLHIIALTANAMEGDREKVIAAGMNDYLTKPLRSHELAASLSKAGGLPTAQT
jgi:PAS domain S-box-containing protein